MCLCSCASVSKPSLASQLPQGSTPIQTYFSPAQRSPSLDLWCINRKLNSLEGDDSRAAILQDGLEHRTRLAVGRRVDVHYRFFTYVNHCYFLLYIFETANPELGEKRTIERVTYRRCNESSRRGGQRGET